MSSEPYRPPKELAGELSEMCGRRVSTRFTRDLIKHSGVKRIGMAARAADLVAWWERHPDYQPRSAKPNGRNPITLL